MRRTVTKRLITFRDVKVASAAVIIILILEILYACYCAWRWKEFGKIQIDHKNAVLKDSLPLSVCKDHEGVLFETCSPARLVAAVESCASNHVNNVFYVGSENGFDCFIHNSDFRTKRFRLHSAKLNVNCKMAMTDVSYKWIAVSEIPSRAASDLVAFLNGTAKERK